MEQQTSPIKNLWFGFTSAIALYVFIAYQSLSQKNQTIVFSFDDLAQGIFLGVVAFSLCLIAIVHYYLPEILKTNEDEKKQLLLNILQLALSEAVGIIGIILFFQKGSFSQLIILCAIALASLLKLFPFNKNITSQGSIN